VETIVLIVHLLVALFLIGVVLLQRSEGGALGIGGGGVMSGRGAANALTRATSILAACFLSTSAILAVLLAGPDPDSSVLDRAPAGAADTDLGPQIPSEALDAMETDLEALTGGAESEQPEAEEAPPAAIPSAPLDE